MNDKITLHELADLFAAKNGRSRTEAERFAEEVLSLMETALGRDKYVKVKGLGTFKLMAEEPSGAEGPGAGGSRPHVRVSFIPDSPLKEQVNKPFAHFSPVLLKEKVSFTDLAEDENGTEPQETAAGEGKAGEADAAAESPTEPDAAEAQGMAPQTETSSPVEEELADRKPIEEETPPEEVVEEKKENTLPEKEEKTTGVPWCMIASVLLTGIFIGGIVTWTLTSGRRYIPEQALEKLMGEAKNKPAPVAQNSPQAADTLAEKADASPAGKTDTLKAAAEKRGTPHAPSAPAAEKQVLADTVEYRITGNQGTYTLKPGESLVRVALKFYGNKNLWPYLVKHNKAILANPDNVPVGTVIQIPQLTPKKK